MLIQAHVSVQQAGSAVYALFGALGLDGDDIPVPIRYYADVSQAPFEDSP